MGLCNYYCDYVPHYAETAYCLTELTKKKAPKELLWLEGHDKAFYKLNKCFVKALSLSIPILGQPFVIHCAASSTSTQACHSQKRKGTLYPISHPSQKLAKIQQS